MRGQHERTGPLSSYVSTEERIPKGHPPRQVRRLADQALDRLNPAFSRLYPEAGRPSIPPEKLLLALLLQAIYGIRSERMLIEQLDYNLLFRWFVGLNPDDPVWLSRVNQVDGRFASTKSYPFHLTPGNTGHSAFPIGCSRPCRGSRVSWSSFSI